MKKLLLIFLGIAVGVALVITFLPDSVKEQGLMELQPDKYIHCEVITSRKSLIGDNWIVAGTLSNSNPDVAVKQVELKFIFSNSSERITVSVVLHSEQLLERPFRVKIPGHGNEDFLGVKVIGVK